MTGRLRRGVPAAAFFMGLKRFDLGLNPITLAEIKGFNAVWDVSWVKFTSKRESA